MKKKMAEPKDIVKKIRLIMNLIAPDTFDKKELEIKELMFTSDVVDEEKKEEAKEETKRSMALDEENLKPIVLTLFRKAQTEKDYGKMYAQLCQNLTREELRKLGFEKTTRFTIPKSEFRRALLKNCRSSFDKLFMTDEAFNALEDEE